MTTDSKEPIPSAETFTETFRVNLEATVRRECLFKNNCYLRRISAIGLVDPEEKFLDITVGKYCVDLCPVDTVMFDGMRAVAGEITIDELGLPGDA